MSGHSKWSTIKRQKGVADIKRGQTFTKVAKAITIAVKMGSSGDPNSNPRLRNVLEEAKEVNMPKDNIQRAIDRGLGKIPGQIIEEVLYEGFGPGKVAFLMEGVTDNKLRTLSELKNIFEKSGGSLAGTGSVSYMFESKGEIIIKSQESRIKNLDEQELELIDLGVDDIEPFEEDGIRKYLVYIDSTKLHEMSNKITQAGYGVEKAEVVLKPNTLTEIKDKETAQKVIDFANRLESHEDIQKVYANFDIPENFL